MSPLITSLDLFSGVGGITHALSGFAKPIAYCEINEDCQRVLQSRMKNGNIPRAPIHHDVKALNAKVLGVKQVDIIVGGWPCQDLSILGKRKGLDGERSGLINEIFRLTDALKPGLLFLENVPAVMINGFDTIIEEFVVKRGYELRWAVVPASAMGAYHVRKRWFGLFIKPGYFGKIRPNLNNAQYQPFFQKRPQEPPRMIIPKTPRERKSMNTRAQMLGNSVVPDAVRAAFITLISGFKYRNESLMSILIKHQQVELNSRVDDIGKPRQPKGSALWGYVKGRTRAQFSVEPPTMPYPKLRIVVDPKTYKKHRGYVPNPSLSTKILTKPVVMGVWSTPRHTSGACNVLTERSVRDLPTQVRFEASTPDKLRSGIISPLFLEWLMGYPKDWTKA